MRRLVLASLVFLIWSTTTFTYGAEIGFIEDFVLAKDRATALKQLVPGTEDHSYFHALYYLQTEQLDKVEPLLAAWVQRHGETPRVAEIKLRHALALYDKNPNKSLDFLRNKLNLTFSHEKQQLDVEPNLPTSLDRGAIGRKAFIERANSITTSDSNQYEDSALDWLIGSELSPEMRQSVLSRLTRPDHAKLTKVLLDEFNSNRAGGFGSLGIHRQLLIPQLEELVKAKSELLNQENFVVAYVTKLQPTADEDWRHNPKQLEAYLDRLWEFATRLSPVHNSLKSHVLYHRLVLDRLRGALNKERFIEYLKLPRNVRYLSKKMTSSEAFKRNPADLNSNYGGATLLAAIGNDEPLVRSYLAVFLVDAANTKEFEPYVNDVYLQHLFAEVKITNGLGNADQWAAQLPPDQFQRLKDRVDIDFAFTNKTQFAADEAVKLDLFLKNAGTLIVKVFEINSQNHYREHLSEINTDIMLDGLVPNFEQTYASEEAPLRRVPKQFEFPQLEKPGVYVVDFIGNGRSSRALIRKGRWKHLVRTVPGGHVFTILDEKNTQVKDAKIWLGGHEYTANEEGAIAVPFTNTPGRQPIVITRGNLSSLDFFQHDAENYALNAGFYVDRESLIARKKAKLLIRPSLLVNGAPISLKLLEQIKLTIKSTDFDDIPSDQVISDIQLLEDREAVYEFDVPARLKAMTFQLTAKVKKQTAGGEQVDLSSDSSIALNQIDATEKIECLHLAKFADNYILEVRGKTGEPKASRPIHLSIKHVDFRQPYIVTLKSDASGQVNLGTLTDIASVSAGESQPMEQTWVLRRDAFTYSGSLHAKVGEPISIPFFRAEQAEASPNRSDISLLEIRGDLPSVDRFSHLQLKGNFAVISKLPAGDYDLLLKSSGAKIHIRVTDGPVQGRYVLGNNRQLELPALPPIQIESLQSRGDGVTIKLANASKFARVHVFATRYLPEYDAFRDLGRVRGPEPFVFRQSSAESVYLTGRNIGDEYRYILDRKFATKYPGNMLDRPSLLLNPWAVRTTESGEQLAEAGQQYGATASPIPNSAVQSQSDLAFTTLAQGNFANLDFLPVGSAVMLNLLPDDNGVIEIPSDAIGPHQQIHVVAVDPLNTVSRSLSLPERKMTFRDLRLQASLDSTKHFTQQKRISLLAGGQTFTFGDVTSSRFETYDSLSKVFSLFLTLAEDEKLNDFSFVLNWPKLSPEEKRTQYSKFAAHELSFFLSKKDPEFFQATIKPYLANKKDKTFLDHYLLDDELSAYLAPWQFEQLNFAERALLAQRISAERAAITRHINDAYSMQPTNVDKFVRLFETALRRGQMENGDAMNFELQQMILGESGEGAGGGRAGGMGGGIAPGSPKPSPDAAYKDGDGARKETESLGKSEKRRAWQLEQDQKDGALKLRSRPMNLKEQRNDALRDGKKLENKVDFYFAQPDLVGARQLFRQMEKTQEWAENNYYKLRISEQNQQLVELNSFWNDFVAHDPTGPFLSKNFAEAGNSAAEAMLALAIIDLPFESPKQEFKLEGQSLTLTAAKPLVLFHEEVKSAEAPEAAGKILVSQNYYRHGDRTRIENGEQIDNYVTGEFLTNVVYGCQVVVTNTTSTRHVVSLLVQIPQGAIPVLKGEYTRTLHRKLDPFQTVAVEYSFYFPSSGEFPHFPVHVANKETIVASTAATVMKVVDKPTNVDTGSWNYISQFGSTEEVLAFLDKHAIVSLDLELIAWRMRDPAVFKSVIAKLMARHEYNHTLWSYSIQHNVPASIREFLLHESSVVVACGGRLKSTLLTIDPVAHRMYEHLEYRPLANARAHSLGRRRQIVNAVFHKEYHDTLRQMSFERQLSDDDLLALTYYLLLQDRVEEAIGTFGRVRVERISTKMQYDYCAAYLDFFTDDHKQARAIAAKYADHPVDRWKNTFAAIVAQLDEAEGNGSKTTDPRDRNQQQAQLTATEPNFDFSVEARQIKLDYQNLKSVRVNFYAMDVELLFSRNPFVQQFRGQFSSIKPNMTLDVTLDDAAAGANAASDKMTSKQIPLPKELQNKNVLVEVIGAGLTKSQPYYSHSLSIQVVENYGQIKVVQQSTGQPLAKTYVKVYAQTAGNQVKFYKDGYTDLRGRFDYASLNTNDLDAATKFSILVLSDEHGAMVREASPPKR